MCFLVENWLNIRVILSAMSRSKLFNFLLAHTCKFACLNWIVFYIWLANSGTKIYSTDGPCWTSYHPRQARNFFAKWNRIYSIELNWWKTRFAGLVYYRLHIHLRAWAQFKFKEVSFLVQSTLSQYVRGKNWKDRAPLHSTFTYFFLVIKSNKIMFCCFFLRWGCCIISLYISTQQCLLKQTGYW